MNTKSGSLKLMMLYSVCLLYFFKTPAFALTDGIPQKAAGETVVYLKLKLSSMAAVTVSKAALKYNKYLALSFPLDNGYRSAFLSSYPLLNGFQQIWFCNNAFILQYLQQRNLK